MERHELEARLRPLISHDCPHLHTCPACEKRLTKAMRLIENYTKSATPARAGTELWTAEKVAAYVGKSSAHAARTWLSQNGIRRSDTQAHPVSGRPQSLYSASEVRAVCFRKALP